MFILVNANNLDREGVVFNTDYVTRIDRTSTTVRIKLIDGSAVIITTDEYKRLNKNIFKVVKLDEV